MSRDTGVQLMTCSRSWRALFVREYLEHRIAFL